MTSGLDLISASFFKYYLYNMIIHMSSCLLHEVRQNACPINVHRSGTTSGCQTFVINLDLSCFPKFSHVFSVSRHNLYLVSKVGWLMPYYAGYPKTTVFKVAKTLLIIFLMDHGELNCIRVWSLVIKLVEVLDTIIILVYLWCICLAGSSTILVLILLATYVVSL